MSKDVINDNTPIETQQEKKKFFPAPDVKEMAQKLIGKYHGILREAKFSYVYKDATWNKDGKPCAGDGLLLDCWLVGRAPRLCADVLFPIQDAHISR